MFGMCFMRSFFWWPHQEPLVQHGSGFLMVRSVQSLCWSPVYASVWFAGGMHNLDETPSNHPSHIYLMITLVITIVRINTSQLSSIGMILDYYSPYCFHYKLVGYNPYQIGWLIFPMAPMPLLAIRIWIFRSFFFWSPSWAGKHARCRRNRSLFHPDFASLEAGNWAGEWCCVHNDAVCIIHIYIYRYRHMHLQAYILTYVWAYLCIDMVLLR